jgi:hypothetical protein
MHVTYSFVEDILRAPGLLHLMVALVGFVTTCYFVTPVTCSTAASCSRRAVPVLDVVSFKSHSATKD